MFLETVTAKKFSVSMEFGKTSLPGFWNCIIGFTAHSGEFSNCNICVFDTEEQINETALRVSKKMLQELTK